MKNTQFPLSINVNFFDLLTLLFIGLKLTDHIDWSWWWVLSPVWIVYIIVIPILLIVWRITK